jgi:DnaD/phage-associated family protein
MPEKSTAFVGFPDTKLRPVVIPELFFSELLPRIDDLAELKLTLHCFWLLNTQEGEVRYLRGADLRRDVQLLQSLGLETDLRSPKESLEEALHRAVARNTLLRIDVELEAPQAAQAPDDGWEDWYFMNTAKGRQTVAMIRAGKLHDLQIAIPEEARLKVERPNIFVLYEQNIGLLNPLIADQLRDLEKTYPPEWIVEAFKLAVANNKQKLRYIQNILKRWETEGKRDHETSGRSSEEQRRRNYIPDEYSDIIVH